MAKVRDSVDSALEAWARWAKSAFAEVGWNPMSIIAKLIKYGAIGAARRIGIRIEEQDDLCELVDRAIRRLPEKERAVIIISYMKHQPVKNAAKEAGMTEANFRQCLHRGRRSVSDYLEGCQLRYNFSDGIMASAQS